jgi:hypothetical protein
LVAWYLADWPSLGVVYLDRSAIWSLLLDQAVDL